MPLGRSAAGRGGRGYQSPHTGANGGQRIGYHALAPAGDRRGNSQRDRDSNLTDYRSNAEPGNRSRLAPRDRAATRVRAPRKRADPTRRGALSAIIDFFTQFVRNYSFWRF